MLVEAPRASLFAAVAIVLLVDAVEFEELLRFLAEDRRVLDELLFDQAPKVVAVGLDRLVF
jgi:hypothetical protein